jgi:hypothetical protein
MLNKTTYYLMVVALLILPLRVNAAWSGYLNTRTMSDLSYGFMVAKSVATSSGTLRFVCLSDNRFYLLFDRKIMNAVSGSGVTVAIDGLPGIRLPLSRFGDDIAVSHKASEFFRLVAQMSAGSWITVGGEHQYSLIGFTGAYQNACGSFETAGRYKQFLHMY